MSRFLPLFVAFALFTACSDDGPSSQDNNVAPAEDTGADASEDTGVSDVRDDVDDTGDPDDVGTPDDSGDDNDGGEEPDADMGGGDLSPPDDVRDMGAEEVGEDASDPGCQGPDSCGDGEVCTGELGCGMAWECVERTCDADDPTVLLCSCEGLTFRAQLSCVGRPAAYVIEQVSPVPEGVMCNPETEGPVYFDIVITGEGFEAHEGLEIHLRVQDTFRGEVAAFGTVTVENGGFTARFDDVFDPDLFGLFLEYYVDTDGNGACDPDRDTVWTEFVNNSFDWEGQEAPVTVRPDAEAPELCSEW